MKLAYWMYAGPAHVGTLRIASSFNNVKGIMHAPLGDDYFNVMQSMLERKRQLTPVTASIVDRHVLARGSQEKVVNNIKRMDIEDSPDLIILTPTCTSSILQEDLQNFVNRASLETQSDVLLADVNHYRVNELQAADRTLEQVIQFYINKAKKTTQLPLQKTLHPSVNIIGAYNLGFHNSHNIAELQHLFEDVGIHVNLVIPEGVNVGELPNLTKAWLNIIPYREIGLLTGNYLKKEFGMPYVQITPIGLMEVARFIRQIAAILYEQGLPPTFEPSFEPYIAVQTRFISQSGWFARSIDCQNLMGKKAFVFGDATHAAAITKFLVRELGVTVVVAGTYCYSDTEWFEKEVTHLCKKVIVTDDYNLIQKLIKETEPNAIFGTQMERHIAKRLNIPAGVISAPVHIQNFPLSYRPFFGYEGANQLADLVYNTFTLGMEDHLLDIFGGHDTKEFDVANTGAIYDELQWSEEALSELNKIPSFVRNKIKTRTESFASNGHYHTITLEMMYAAKEAAMNSSKKILEKY